MISAAIVEHLRETIDTTVLRRIEGALDFAGLKPTAPPQAPSAFVIPVTESARPNSLTTGVAQMVSVTIAVLIVVKAVNDPAGRRNVDAFDGPRQAVRGALLGWPPSEAHTPLEYARGRMDLIGDGLAWWRDEFTTTSLIRAT